MRKKFLYTILIFLVSVSFLSVTSIIFYNRLNQLTVYSDAIDHKNRLIIQLNKLMLNIRSVESHQRGFQLTGDSQYLRHDFLEQAMQAEDNLSQLVSGNPDMEILFNQLRLLIRERIMYVNEIANLKKPDTSSLNQLMINSQQTMLKVRDKVAQMEQTELQSLEKEYAQKRFYERVTPTNFKILFFFSLFVFIISVTVLLREIRLRMGYQKILEKKIQELNRTNEELEQLAFIASHDLQEPLRKIRMFSNILAEKNSAKLGEEMSHMLDRMNIAAGRMQDLLQDVISFTRIIKMEEDLTSVDLNSIVHDVQLELQSEIRAKSATLKTEPLLIVNGYPKQLHILFKELIENSLKFLKPGHPPVIAISVVNEKKQDGSRQSDPIYYEIILKDNGIGFDDIFADKMFLIFQRLHHEEAGYEGKGMGLAIVKRIMVNHGGYVKANGEEGEGAAFHLYFPAR